MYAYECESPHAATHRTSYRPSALSYACEDLILCHAGIVRRSLTWVAPPNGPPVTGSQTSGRTPRNLGQVMRFPLRIWHVNVRSGAILETAGSRRRPGQHQSFKFADCCGKRISVLLLLKFESQFQLWQVSPLKCRGIRSELPMAMADDSGQNCLSDEDS